MAKICDLKARQSDPKNKSTRLSPAAHNRPSALGADLGKVLASLVCNQILPELNSPGSATFAQSSTHIFPTDVATLRSCIADADPQPTMIILRNLKQRGVSRQAVLLDLFTPVARQMNDEWLAGDCTFAEVTLGIARLARLMRSEAMPPLRAPEQDEPRTILLASCSRENRSFNLLVLEDQFKAEGWKTEVVFAMSPDDLCKQVAQKSLDVISLSLANDYQYGTVANIVRQVRVHSSNPDIIVLVGGAAFTDKPSTALALGADGAAGNAIDAVSVATTLLQSRAGN